jgi:uncharacterized protein (TIGR02598 family)
MFFGGTDFFLEYIPCISYVNTKINFFPMKIQNSKSQSSGFTLAEVMIAMGIVASVMVGLLGMIPLGVRTIREATNLTISGRIAQEVISNVQQANWQDVITGFDKKVFKFDNEGFFIRAADTTSQPSFKATVTVPDNAIKFGQIDFDKSTLKKIIVEVEFTPAGKSVPVKEAGKPNPNILRYNFFVANQNKTSST